VPAAGAERAKVRIVDEEPTVVMNGLMRTTATRRPFASPNNSPTMIAAPNAIHGG
jgi:hypothetical protein